MAGPGGAPADASRRDRRRSRGRRGGGPRSRRGQARAPARYVLPGVPRPGGAPLLSLPGLTRAADPQDAGCDRPPADGTYRWWPVMAPGGAGMDGYWFVAAAAAVAVPRAAVSALLPGRAGAVR